MSIRNALNIVHDLIVENIHPASAILAHRDWTRHMRRAVPEPRNAYGYPVAQDANLTVGSAV